jgi:hypothetical protein
MIVQVPRGIVLLRCPNMYGSVRDSHIRRLLASSASRGVGSHVMQGIEQLFLLDPLIFSTKSHLRDPVS